MCRRRSTRRRRYTSSGSRAASESPASTCGPGATCPASTRPSSSSTPRPPRRGARCPRRSPRSTSPSTRLWPDSYMPTPACRVGHPPRHNGRVAVEMDAQRFEDLVGEALDEVPPELLDLMDNVVILVADEPPDDEPDLLGLYEGHALTERGWSYSGVLPDRITIFRNPILAICDSEQDVVDEVAVTVVHEIAHHFGIDDARLHELGWA